MSLGTLHFYSEVLHSSQTVNIVLPEPRTIYPLPKEDMEVLYLLHGMQGSAHSWVSSSSVERYLYESGRNMAIVIPTMKSNFYTDHKIGDAYFTYVAEELPKIIESYLHISQEREHTYVAGLSMGGYGAVKLALNYPQKFKMAASFSGALGMHNTMERAAEQDMHHLFNFIYGSLEEYTDSINDTSYLLEKCVQDKSPLPNLYISCGTADSLLPANKAFVEKARSLGYQVKFHIEKEMGHAWRFWDLEIEKLLRSLL